jgi:hypothetical protein
MAIAMIALLLLVSIVVVVEIARDGSKKDTPPDAAPLVGTGLVTVRGLIPRSRPAIAWTGDRLFVFGGTKGEDPGTLATDGALVDVMTGDAFALPPAPFKAPLLDPTAARVGNEIVVLGLDCPGFASEEDSASVKCTPGHGHIVAASFNISGGSWKLIPTPAELEREAGTTEAKPWVSWMPVVTGVSGDALVFSFNPTLYTPSFWSLTPGTRSWRSLGSPGVSTNGCMAGDHVAVLTARYSANGTMLSTEELLQRRGGSSLDAWVQPTLRFLDVARPEGGWQASPTLDDVKYPLQPDISCMGARVMVTGPRVGPDGGARVYDTSSHAWSTPPPPPSAPGVAVGAELGPRVWTGTELLSISDLPNFPPATSGGATTPAPGWAYNPTTNSWREIPSFPAQQTRPQVAGHFVVDYSPPSLKVTKEGVSQGDRRPLAVHYSPR